jgi:ribonuclease III
LFNLRSLFRKNNDNQSLSDSIANIFGFRPKNIALYRQAFRHKSMAQATGNGFRHSNERLEYLGDAVLGSCVADFLFKKFPYKDEGFLTEIRSRIVSRQNLNSLSRKLGIDRLILTSRENQAAGTSILGDAFEAFIGALYLDKGYRFTYKIIVTKIIQTHLDLDELVTKEVNFKSKLIEWSQKEKRELEFEVVEEQENNKKIKLYIVSLKIDKKEVAQGRDYSIKKAEQSAAAQAWEVLLKEEGFSLSPDADL